MKATKTNIQRYYNVIYRNIAQINSIMTLERVIEALDCLLELVIDFEGETLDIWYIGEYNEFGLDDLIVGSYWFVQQHYMNTQSLDHYTLQLLECIYTPNMSQGPEGIGEQSVYELLEMKLNGVN